MWLPILLITLVLLFIGSTSALPNMEPVIRWPWFGKWYIRFSKPRSRAANAASNQETKPKEYPEHGGEHEQ